jgi:hypothetical protein
LEVAAGSPEKTIFLMPLSYVNVLGTEAIMLCLAVVGADEPFLKSQPPRSGRARSSCRRRRICASFGCVRLARASEPGRRASRHGLHTAAMRTRSRGEWALRRTMPRRSSGSSCHRAGGDGWVLPSLWPAAAVRFVVDIPRSCGCLDRLPRPKPWRLCRSLRRPTMVYKAQKEWIFAEPSCENPQLPSFLQGGRERSAPISSARVTYAPIGPGRAQANL